ncbi:transmembrane protein, putative (macronuclear) [Tetrahymena thermophila SB210]|uniref:Transmembrane protein, putative n=1 Tax=Tetrahymena thermophila (strain SB210) TaxID=312017 RepID=Q236T9_TETTS|nr:transmembrane protein, putative [Tetrahymena thermophila SB210]EAR92411.1 transmembrane protein, putative [Tetrahymena thermophila SB210]|eukprot:XP_001012656.1 transmembrane protein, putative [Tetrahymena thermophila SB210]
MKSNFPQDQIDFFPFGEFSSTIQKSLSDGSFYFALSVSFSFLVLVLLCYIYKAYLYKKKGYLKVEKNQLKYLFRNSKSNSKGGQHNRRLLSLMTDEGEDEKDEHFQQNKMKSKNIRNKQLSNSKINHKSQMVALKKPLSFQNEMNFICSKNEVTICEQRAKNLVQSSNQDNVQNINVVSQICNQEYQMSKSGPFLNDQQSNIVTALASPSKNNSEKQQMLFGQQNNAELNNQAEGNFRSRSSSVANSFSSAPRSHRFQSTADTASITPQSVNCSQSQPQSINQKLIDSFTNIVVVQEKSNPSTVKQYSNFKEIENNQLKSLTDQLQKSNENHLLSNQKIKSQTIQKEKAVAKKNQDFMADLEKQMQKQEKNALELSFDKIVIHKETNFCQRLTKNWIRLFQNHCIIFNTFKEDMIVFPRQLKVLLICLFVNLKFFTGSLIQIYFFNKEVERLQYKYMYRSDHIMNLEKILPKDDIASITFEIIVNAGITILLTLLICILCQAAKAEKDIIYINYNNQQLLNNIKVIQGIQSYKLFVGLIVSFALGSLTFLQYISVIQLIKFEFVKRWLAIDALVFLFYFCFFDLFYLTLLSLIKAASKTSARCHLLHRYLIKKLSWWQV